jgi:hypothetical protein
MRTKQVSEFINKQIICPEELIETKKAPAEGGFFVKRIIY